MKKDLIILLFTFLACNLFAQDSISFNIKLSKDTIFIFETIELNANIKNISNNSIKIVLPWNDENFNIIKTGSRPFLQINDLSTSSLWQFVKNSDINISHGHVGDYLTDSRLVLSASEITPNASSSISMIYSPYTCESRNRARLDSSLHFPIFPKIGHYKLRLCFYNEKSSLEGYSSMRGKIDEDKLIYSNEVDIYVNEIPKEEKKAVTWLKKHKNCVSLIYSPTILEPLVTEKPLSIFQLKEFIRLFPKSMFIPYAKIQLAEELRMDYKKKKTKEDYENIIKILSFPTKNEKILKKQAEIRANCEYSKKQIK